MRFSVQNPLWAYFHQKMLHNTKICSENFSSRTQLSSLVIGQKYMPN
jgi:hypothetical protein